ncbi:growth/differentiation factor 8-like isoform X2 [Mya arenaria]|uniref:growth/differentiation factor 8-like isoform X2 n=1 Tax=Mya arenaria TaxID=6604 RepID=UPI0022E789C3|nr:growth/differentiation factor 8-like isoform X2 [Mya arenaria]
MAFQFACILHLLLAVSITYHVRALPHDERDSEETHVQHVVDGLTSVTKELETTDYDDDEDLETDDELDKHNIRHDPRGVKKDIAENNDNKKSDGSAARSNALQETDDNERDSSGSSNIRESAAENSGFACPHCSDTIKEKTERIKHHILDRLGMDTAPKVGGPLPPLPFDFYTEENYAMSDEDYQEPNENNNRPKVREIFITGTDITDKCYQQKGTGCYSFNVSADVIDPARVQKIELWVYKQSDPNDHFQQTFMVSELAPTVRDGSPMLRIRNIVKRQETRMKYGWMRVYVMRAVIRWLSKPHRNHGLAIVCKTCQRRNHRTIYGDKEGLLPILVFYMNDKTSSRRQRRSVACREGGDQCCHKETLEINFRDIGWDYIMAPPKIRPNFCTGSCNGRINSLCVIG